MRLYEVTPITAMANAITITKYGFFNASLTRPMIYKIQLAMITKFLSFLAHSGRAVTIKQRQRF